MTEQALVEHTEPEIIEHEPQSESAAVLSIIDRATRDPSVDIDKLERLLEMRERITARESEMAFVAAMKAAQADMPQVVRDAKNTHTRSRYAKLETISEAITPIYTKHGFSLTFGTEDCPKDNHYRVVCDCMHEGGHVKRYHADIPADGVGAKGNQNKTATHAFGSTMSYARRYLKLLVFDIALKDEDDDGNAVDNTLITEEQRGDLLAAVEAAQADIVAFCRYFKIDAVPDLPARQFDDAMTMLRAKRSGKARS